MNTKPMLDVILHVPNFYQLVVHLTEHHPEMLDGKIELGSNAEAEDDSETEGEDTIVSLPVVTGFARTPAAMGADGNSLMVYARLRENEVEAWRDMPGVNVLGEMPFTGPGTGQAVYDQVFADPDKAAHYDSVYDRAPYDVEDEDGETTTVTPPPMFGLMAGA